MQPAEVAVQVRESDTASKCKDPDAFVFSRKLARKMVTIGHQFDRRERASQITQVSKRATTSLLGGEGRFPRTKRFLGRSPQSDGDFENFVFRSAGDQHSAGNGARSAAAKGPAAIVLTDVGANEAPLSLFNGS